MSRAFLNASSEYLTGSYSTVPDYPFAMSIWIYPTTANNRMVFSVAEAATTNYWAMYLAGGTNLTGLVYDGDQNHEGGSGAGTVTQDAWNHGCLLFDASDDLRVIANGTNRGTDANDSDLDPTNIDIVRIGSSADSTPLWPFDGSLAEAAIWDLADWPGADAEAKCDNFEAIALPALADGFSPLFFPLGLTFYVPLIRDDDLDRFTGNILTVNGTPTVDVHPPILYPAPPIVLQSTAAAPGGVTVEPAPASAVASSQAPTVVHGSITVAPSAAQVVASAVDPTVVHGSINVTPATSSAVASTQDPTVVHGSVTVSPSEAQAVASTQDPTVVHGSITVAPATSYAVASTVDPTIPAVGVTVSPNPATAVASTQDPTVVHGSITVAPATSYAVASTTDPGIVFGSVTVTPATSSAVASTQDPTVVEGGIIVSPTAASAVASTQDPTVVHGSITVTPTNVYAVASTTDPTVVYGSISITPTEADAIASTQDPTVRIAAGVDVTPNPASAVASTVDPVVAFFASVGPVIRGTWLEVPETGQAELELATVQDAPELKPRVKRAQEF